MRGIGDLLGHRELAEQICRGFTAQQLNTLQSIIGPSGSGKTELAKRCEMVWETGANNSSLWLRGDSHHSRDSYAPFETGLDEVLERIRHQERRIPVYDAGYRMGGLTPIVGFIKRLIEGINTDGSRLQIEPSAFRYIAALKRVAGGSKLLLILDDVQDWDETSTAFLRILFSLQASREFPFLQRFKYLLLFKGTAPEYSAWIQRITDQNMISAELEYPPRAAIPEILTAFGFEQSVTENLLDQIFSVTGGHLSLLKNLALALTQGAREESSDFVPEQALASRRDLLDKAISIRLRNNPNGDAIERLLSSVSIIGEIFDRKEIACISRALEASDQPDEYIRMAVHAGLMREVNQRYSFEHEIIRRYFFEKSPQETIRLNGTFAECLRTLRPGAYHQRAKHLKLANREFDADSLEALELLRATEEGEVIADEARARLFDLFRRVDDAEIIQTVEVLIAAILSLAHGDSEKAYQSVKKLSSISHSGFEGWRLYLLMRGAVKTRNRRDVESALQESLAQHAFISEEFDVAMRVKSVEIVCFVYLGRQEDALREYHRLIGELRNRVKFDPLAAFQIAVLQRKSPALFNCERAVGDCENAVEYFRPEASDDLPLYPRQLFTARTNLAGCLMCVGRFLESAKESVEALKLAESMPPALIPGIDHAASNYIVASYLGGFLDIHAAASEYQSVIAICETSQDKYLVMLNSAVFSALQGRTDIAITKLKDLLKLLEANAATDSYYFYFTLSNMSWACHEQGDKSEALRFFSISTEHKNCVHMSDQKFVDVRHSILEKFITEGVRLSVDEVALVFHEMGSRLSAPWSFWGRPYILSDIQFWSMS